MSDATAATADRSAPPQADALLQLLVVVSVAVVIAFNAGVNIWPLGGQTTGAVSDQFQTYFTPPGYVFAIWGVIYLGLIGFAAYQARPDQRHRAPLTRVRGLVVASSVLNIMWLVLWHYEQFELTVLVMVLLLQTLIAIYARLRRDDGEVSVAERWLVRVPFSLYLAWITVATIANVTILLVHWGWSGAPLTGPAWSAIMLVVGALVAARVVLDHHDAAWVSVLAWAYVGLAVKYNETPLVAGTALAATLGLFALLAVVLVRSRLEQLEARAG